MRQIGRLDPINSRHLATAQTRDKPRDIQQKGPCHVQAGLLRGFLQGHHIVQIGPEFFGQIGAR